MIKKYFLGIATVFVISLIYSRFLVSVCMLGFVILALVDLVGSKKIAFLSFAKDKSYIGLLLVFLAVALSGFNSEDTSQWLHEVKIKLPFLLLPLAFFILKPFDRKSHQWIHTIFIGTVAVSSVFVLTNFYSNFQELSLSIGKGKSIPTPIDHIHYSIMLAYATVTAFILGVNSQIKKYKAAYIFAGIYLFAFAHFLSVRTGLALSYGGIAITLVWYVVTRKKYITGAVIAAAIVALPYIAFHTIEPFKRKINYMYWDYARYKEGKGKSYSDSERLMSYDIAIDLIKEKPLVGHGIGDLRPIMIRKHKEKFGDKEKYIYPHNQYLYVLTTMGLLGALLFFVGLFCPLIFAESRNIYLVTIFLLMAMSFMVENTIQRAVITGFFLFFILINLGYRPEGTKPEQITVG